VFEFPLATGRAATTSFWTGNWTGGWKASLATAAGSTIGSGSTRRGVGAVSLGGGSFATIGLASFGGRTVGRFMRGIATGAIHCTLVARSGATIDFTVNPAARIAIPSAT